MLEHALKHKFSRFHTNYKMFACDECGQKYFFKMAKLFLCSINTSIKNIFFFSFKFSISCFSIMFFFSIFYFWVLKEAVFLVHIENLYIRKRVHMSE